jgi:hypothetical protein
VSKLGAVPTPEESARLAAAQERRFNLLGALFLLAIAVWLAQGPPSLLFAVPSAMALWRLYLAFRPTSFLGEKDRRELRQRALTDLRAARRLRALLRQDMKGHALMRRNLARMVPLDERAAALQVLDQWDRTTKAQLTDVESAIAQLSDG